MSRRMVLTQFGDAEVLELETASRPTPRRGEVVVRNHAAAVNFIDTIVRRGAMPPGTVELPHVPGVEGSGVIDVVGEGVNGLSPGDPVVWIGPVGTGGYATFSLLAPHAIARLPHGADPTTAAALPVNAVTAWQLLVNLGRVRPGETVLVRAAAGGVGTMLIQLAKHLGAKVIAVCADSKLAYVKAQGADHAISYASDDVPGEIQRLTQGRGVDVACNPVSGDTVLEDLSCLAPFGRLLIFGFLAGPPRGSFAPDLVQHFNRSVGVSVSDIYTLFNERPDAFKSALEQVLALYAQGILRPHVHAVVPLHEAAKAHAMIERAENLGKVILDIDG